RGDLTQAQQWLHKTLAINPDDGDALCQLAELYLDGRQYEAAAQVCRSWLTRQAESGDTPFAKRVSGLLEEALRHAQRAPRAARAEPETRPDKPTLTIAPAPPLTEEHERAAPPTPRTRFFGRETEIAQLTELLRDPACGCITLTGLGGVGKTRLALELAHRLQTQGEVEVFWAPLQSLTEPEQILPTIAEALGLPASADPLTTLKAFCKARGAVVLFLDNFEQLLPAGASSIASMLEQVPSLRCLITSRLPLRIGAELVFPLAPLSCTPTPECPALQLFVDRARRTAHDFRLTEQNRPLLHALCEQLGGVPLALELAAARLNTLSPKQMLERIEAKLEWLRARRADLPERHRSLQGVLDATVELLPKPARVAFARLSLISGAWNFEQACAIALPHAVRDEAHALLESLLEAQLIQRIDADHYRMLEVVREYAQTLLTPTQRRTTQARLCAWTLREARARAPHAYTAELPNWLDFWDASRPVLLQTLNLLEEQGEYHQCLSLMHDTQRYWQMRPLHEDALQRLARLIESGKLSPRDYVQAQLMRLRLLFDLERFREALPLALELGALDRRHSQRGWALYWIVQIAFTLREMSIVNRYWNALQAYYPCEADPELHLAIHYLKGYLSSVGDFVVWREAEYQSARATGDPKLQIGALTSLTEALMFYGDYERLLHFLDELCALCKRLGDQLHLISALHVQTHGYLQLGRLDEVQAQIDAVAALERELGLHSYYTDWLQAQVYRWQGEPERGLTLVLAQVALMESQGNWHAAATMLDTAAQCAYESGDLDAALRHSDAALRLRRSEIDAPRLHYSRTHHAYYRAMQGDASAISELEECLRFWRKLGWRPWQANTLYYLGEAYAKCSDYERARACLQEATQLNQQMGRALALQRCEMALEQLNHKDSA
ncbi:MAG: AAA family ATPase, partial [Fimbriimonadales bacterium]|nr:AAA family ATPase [Fimbriimonadales bacterium]